MKLSEVIDFLEELAPPALQEDYDNSGLLAGSRDMEVKGVLASLDCTEEVVDEAISKGCNVVVSHHPLIFKALKKVTGSNFVERTLIKAIKNDVALYAIHTNLDNVMHGVNARICDKLGVENRSILRPRAGELLKLAVFVPRENADRLREGLFRAGAGQIGHYDECSFNLDGTGTFRGDEESNPALGQQMVREFAEETKVEVLLPAHKLGKVLKAMVEFHPYEEVAHDVYRLENSNQEEGSGMIGDLEEPMGEKEFLEHVKKVMNAGCIKHTDFLGSKVKKVAVCGGAGGFLLGDAIKSGADVLITSDFKYHDFFNAEGRILIADIGHFESEQFTRDLLVDKLQGNFNTFAVHLSEVNTNPVNYF